MKITTTSATSFSASATRRELKKILGNAFGIAVMVGGKLFTSGELDKLKDDVMKRNTPLK